MVPESDARQIRCAQEPGNRFARAKFLQQLEESHVLQGA
jgi:hypothetical protein